MRVWKRLVFGVWWLACSLWLGWTPFGVRRLWRLLASCVHVRAPVVVSVASRQCTNARLVIGAIEGKRDTLGPARHASKIRSDILTFLAFFSLWFT
jgi:hypothetical protein